MRRPTAAWPVLLLLAATFPSFGGEPAAVGHRRAAEVVLLAGAPQLAPATPVRYAVEFLPRETPVSALMTPEGDVWLFRVIDQPYIRGYRTPFMKEEGGISFSLNPHIAEQWVARGQDLTRATLLIAKNKVRADGLLFPAQGDSVGRRVSGRLSPATRLEDIAYLDTVVVPVSKENVLLTVPLAQFQRKARALGPGPTPLSRLIQAAASLAGR